MHSIGKVCLRALIATIFSNPLLCHSSRPHPIEGAMHASRVHVWHMEKMPSQDEMEYVRLLMNDLEPQVDDVKEFLQTVVDILPIRAKTIRMTSEAIDFLNEQHRNVNIAKVKIISKCTESRAVLFLLQATGNSVSLVGDGLLVGGLIAAPFTLGVSLIISTVGGGVCAIGGATSAGAGLVELAISKKKVAEIQDVIDEDNKRSKKLKEKWDKITAKCDSVAKKFPQMKYSPEDVFAVLLVCCVQITTDKELQEAVKEKGRRALESVKETGSHALDIVSGLGSGACSLQAGGQAIGSAVLTALIVKFAPKGSRAVTHCSKMAGISSKIVTASKLFRVATGVTPLSIVFTAVGASLT